MNSPHIIDKLIEENFLKNENIETEKLTGGVSSDIYLITDGENRFVIKEALPRLKVEDEWYADTSRNQVEQEFIRYIQQFLPDAVPEILYSDREHGYFVMEYLDSSFKNWKKQLLQAKFEPATAKKAARLLADIHLYSKQNEKAGKRFNTTPNFKSLRIEPYLITTGNRHPELKELFHSEADRLENHREALVHGDFSPKNIMVKSGRIVLLDHEVAWFGDPAFDVAFLLNHLYLKMLLNADRVDRLPDLRRIVWDTYFDRIGRNRREGMESDVGRLLLMLMLARVDGKSPVEYLGDAEQEVVRSFVHDLLPNGVYKQQDIYSKWSSKIKEHAGGN